MPSDKLSMLQDNPINGHTIAMLSEWDNAIRSKLTVIESKLNV